MILVFPEETYITILPALYFLELDHFSQVSSCRLTPSCPCLVSPCHPHLVPPQHPCLVSPCRPCLAPSHCPAPRLVIHAPSCPVVHGLSRIINSSHPP